MINNPVHIIAEDGVLLPTALIPFCKFGGNMSVMGVKIDQFDVPVCNSFRPKIILDQLCYTVDPNKFKTLVNQQELDITLFINYNEDRQYNDASLSSSTDDKKITVESIGIIFFKIYLFRFYEFSRSIEFICGKRIQPKHFEGGQSYRIIPRS